MNERSKFYLSIVFIAFAFTLPFIGLAVGWSGKDFQRGAEMALIIFWYYLILSALFLALIKEPSWLMIALPYCIGVLYMITPDLIPGGLDDAVVMGIMAIVTFVLWRKKQPNLPWWGIVPLLGLAAYEIIGGFVFGPFDEILVAVLCTGIAIAFGTRTHDKNKKKSLPTADNACRDKEYTNKINTIEESVDVEP